METTIDLARWARESRSAAISSLEILTVASLTAAGSEVYINMPKEDRSRGDYRGELVRRADAAGLADRPVFERLVVDQSSLEFETVKAFKKALLLNDWIDEVKTSDIERRYRVWAGAVRRIGEEYAWLVDAASAIVAALVDQYSRMAAASLLPDNFPGFVDIKPPPKGWRRAIDRMGPAFYRHHLAVRVSEHLVDGRRVRAVSVVAEHGLPNHADLDRVAGAFLASGHGVISESPPREGSRMLMLTRSLDPVDPNSLAEIGAAMQREERADVLISNGLRLQSRAGRNKMFIALYAVVHEALPMIGNRSDRTIPMLRAVKALAIAVERAAGDDAKLEGFLSGVTRLAQKDLAAIRSDADDEYTTALHACVWALLDYFQGKREAAVDCVRLAARAITTGRAKTTVASEGDAFRFLGNVVREFIFGDGDNPWFVEEDGEVRVSQGAQAATN